MELAVHIRRLEQKDEIRKVHEHVVSLYDGAAIDAGGWSNELPQSCNRIYIGDEFCSNRLPLLDELEALLQFAKERKGRYVLISSYRP
jgi:hypothetical protein